MDTETQDQLEMKLINKDAMIASLLAERIWVRENCCKECLSYFDAETDDASILIREWEEGKR
jgi:hypothetical protein